jgi:hypothetical protein
MGRVASRYGMHRRAEYNNFEVNNLKIFRTVPFNLLKCAVEKNDICKVLCAVAFCYKGIDRQHRGRKFERAR